VFDFLAYLRGKGVNVTPSASDPNEFRIDCLFCEEMGTTRDYKGRLGFNLESGLANCFNCGWRSRSALYAILKKLGADGGELAQVTEVPITRQTRTRSESLKLPEDAEFIWDLPSDDDWYGSAVRYALRRGITREQMKRHAIMATIRDWKWRQRLIFPAYDRDGKLMGYTGRDWTNKQEPRYLLTTGFKVVYNGRPDLYPDRLVILSEGVTKMLAIERAVRNKICSAATMGKNITDIQIMQLKGFKEVCLFPDPDRQGLLAYLGSAANMVTQFPRVTVAGWSEKQADELEPGEIRELIRRRQPYSALLEMQLRQEARRR